MVSCLMMVACCQPCPPAERYLVVLFGSDDGPARARYTHTWATYAKATRCDAGWQVEPHTISWLPDDGQIRFRVLKRVPGRNYTLEQTYAYAECHREVIKVWGPYETDAFHFAEFLAQKARLDAGGLEYRSVDSIRQPGVTNCVTALRDADPALRGTSYPPFQVGYRGSAATAKDLLRVGSVSRTTGADWLLPVLGAEGFLRQE